MQHTRARGRFTELLVLAAHQRCDRVPLCTVHPSPVDLVVVKTTRCPMMADGDVVATCVALKQYRAGGHTVARRPLERAGAGTKQAPQSYVRRHLRSYLGSGYASHLFRARAQRGSRFSISLLHAETAHARSDDPTPYPPYTTKCIGAHTKCMGPHTFGMEQPIHAWCAQYCTVLYCTARI